MQRRFVLLVTPLFSGHLSRFGEFTAGNVRSPAVHLCSTDCHSASSFGCAVSFGAHKSPDNLLEVHPECGELSQELEVLGLQPRGLYFHKGPFCRSCQQVGGARTRLHQHQTAVLWCYETTELRETRTVDEVKSLVSEKQLYFNIIPSLVASNVLNQH